MLFRKQVVEAQQVRLYGKVLIVSPISFWFVSLFLAAIAISLITFLATASFARIETVSGAVVPSGGIVQVMAPGAGTVREFTLSEGQQVTEGEVLGRISARNLVVEGDGTRNGARLSSIAERLTELEKRRGQSAIVDRLDMAAKEREVVEIDARLRAAEQMLAFQTKILVEQEAAWERTQSLAERNLVNATILSQQNLARLSSRSELSRLQGEFDTLTLQRDNIAFSREQARARADLRNLEFDAQYEALISERQIMVGLEAFDIVAPASGTATAIFALEEHEVQTSTQLFSLLPNDSVLEVELYVPSRAVGFIAPGQDVSLLFDAFPYQRFGSQRGTIVEVTSSVILPNSSGLLVQLQEPVYRVTVALARETVMAFGRDMRIQPGMLLKANIILEDRTALDWLLEPLISVARRNG